MPSFTKSIAIEDGSSPEFFFNRIHTVTGTRYYISVVDKRKHSYFFNMEEKNGSWKIINAPKIPDWIMAVEKKLEAAIFENRKE